MIIGIDASALLKPNPTGVENYARFLLASMMAEPLFEGERVLLYARDEKPSGLMLPSGWEWRSLPFSMSKGWTHFRLSRELHEHSPDVFFSPAHEIPLATGTSKVVTTIHDVVFAVHPKLYSRLQNMRQRFAVRYAVSKASRIIAVSEATKGDLVDYFKASADKISVVHHAPTMTEKPASEMIEAVLAKYHLERGKYFFYLGRIEDKKNVRVIVEAFNLYKLYKMTDVKLVLAGSMGYGGEEIKLLAEGSNASKDIVFLGYTQNADVPSLYAGALAFVFPSVAEGFGLPVLEAMSMGTPVLLSDITVFHEVAGSAALYASSSDARAFAEKMKELAESAELRLSLRDRGLAQAEKYTWVETAKKTWEALRSV
ncbi:MAG: glycosyltransferase family 1 protein [Patescibacteria group bacterium]|jgi:glycosyltransferase involved in cell wall biosynthesis